MKALIILGVIAMAAIVQAEETKSEQVVSLLKQGDGGILATINVDKPYVSSTPFIIDKDGNPVIFISDLALHTKNINKNPNVSIIVKKPDKNGSYFNGSRVTVNGKMVKVTDEKEAEACKKIYMGRYKEAEDWADFGDFNYFKLEPTEIYLIGGFGEIDWVDLKDYKAALKK